MEITIDLLPSALNGFSRLNKEFRYNSQTSSSHMRILRHLRESHGTAIAYTKTRDVPGGKRPLLYVCVDNGFIKAYPDWEIDSRYSGRYFKSGSPSEDMVSQPENISVNWIARHVSEYIPRKIT